MLQEAQIKEVGPSNQLGKQSAATIILERRNEVFQARYDQPGWGFTIKRLLSIRAD